LNQLAISEQGLSIKLDGGLPEDTVYVGFGISDRSAVGIVEPQGKDFGQNLKKIKR